MQMVVIDRFGAPDVLGLASREVPSPKAGEVRVRVEAAGVNYTDTLLRSGAFGTSMPLPLVIGNEVAGTIDAVGPGVDAILVGDRVAAPLFVDGLMGGYAEFVIAPAASLVALPDSVTAAEASALMVQGFTALHLVKSFPIAGKRAFIHAAAGGVGSLLVQLARLGGASAIIAGASNSDKLRLATAGGATQTVNYGATGWLETFRVANPCGVDIIFDSAGGAVSAASLALLAPSGQMVAYGLPTLSTFTLAAGELNGVALANQSINGFSVMPLLNREAVTSALGELFGLVGSGRLRPQIGKCYRLAEAALAHRDIEARRSSGKLVLVP